MNPSLRLLKVMEYLMSAGDEPIKQIQIARDLSLSPATVSRIVRSLASEGEGYVLLTSEKYCVPNFRLSRKVPMSQHYLLTLNQLMQDVSTDYKVSVEAVPVRDREAHIAKFTQILSESRAILKAQINHESASLRGATDGLVPPLSEVG